MLVLIIADIMRRANEIVCVFTRKYLHRAVSGLRMSVVRFARHCKVPQYRCLTYLLQPLRICIIQRSYLVLKRCFIRRAC